MSGENSTASAAAQPARQLKISCHNCMQKLDVTGFSPFARFQCPVCGAELIVPAWFDTYLLEERSGKGGMAAVYRALDPALDREVAIKVLKPEISGDPERVELFLHEARAAATINHFAVVPIYTCGVYENQAYIVMQYMSGGTLEQRLDQARDKLPIPEVAVWIRDIAEGLENAMEHGVIHHDVKPGNILLDSDGKARIGDFGIAQIVHSGKSDSEEESIQEIAKTWLSPHYVSPEKVRTGKEGSEGDIYSLGATFYHLLTGIPPFCDENVEALLRKRLNEKPLPPHFHRPEIDMELSRLIVAMLSRSPSDRPSYKVIIATLDRFIKERSQSTETHPAKEIRPKSSSPRRKRRPGPAALPVSRGSRFPVAGLLLLFVLLAVGAGGLYYVWQQGFANFSSDAPGNAEMTVRDSDRDPNPEITQSLASGNLVSASVFADVVASDPSLPLKKRYVALFQHACALYLAADGDPRAAIRRRLAVLEDPGAAGNGGEKAALLAGIRLLAGLDPQPTAESAGKAGAEVLTAQCLLSAEKSLSSADEARHLPQKIDSLEKALDELPDGSWLSAAWKKHIPAWRQTVLRRSGKKEEVEPLFARLIVKAAEWAGPSAFSPGSFPDMSGDLPAFETVDGNAEKPLPDLSSATLKSASEKYLKYGRPVPEAPARISGKGMDPYLKHVPAEFRPDEERRLRMMCQLRSYIAALAAGGAYQADKFTLTDHTTLGSGEAFFNERYPVYRIRREDGQFENRRLDWDRIPAREALNILLYYTTYREDAVSAGDAGGGSAEKLADAFLRYAVFAQWYGYYDEAARAAEKARTLLPGSRTEKNIEHLLLR